MELLNAQLDALIERMENSERLRDELETLVSIYPFSKYDYVISTLFAHQKLSFDEYLEIREDYINRNIYLYVFEISAPRTFGDTWGFGHLKAVEPDLQRPNKKIDTTYNGEYDLYLDWINPEDNTTHHIKIEVKASRAVDRAKAEEPLYVKALSSTSYADFLMNFQQIKPKCCDVFLWVAVYRDAIKYWLINSDIIQNNKNFTPQHRNQSTAARADDYTKADIYEGQIMLTKQNIAEFDAFLSTGRELKDKIIEQYKLKKAIK
jgi:hypothetical protein